MDLAKLQDIGRLRAGYAVHMPDVPTGRLVFQASPRKSKKGPATLPLLIRNLQRANKFQQCSGPVPEAFPSQSAQSECGPHLMFETKKDHLSSAFLSPRPS